MRTSQNLDQDAVSDEQLAENVQNGDMDSFEILATRYEKRIYSFIRNRVGHPIDAEDLTQQTFVAVYKNIHRFDHNYRFVTWIYTIARRLAISHYRRQRPSEEVDAALPDNRPGPEARTAEKDERAVVWSVARKELKETYFTALWLCYREDMSIRQIAKAMDKTQVHVKVILHRARERLSKILREQGVTR